MDLSKVRTGIEQKLYELTSEIVSGQGYELYDVEYISGSSTLRVFIMNSDTKTAIIEDCIKVDRAFSPYCETEDWIPGDFVLEVSSPGVYRSLKTLKHFEDSVGDYVLLTLNKALDEDIKAKLPRKFKNEKKIRVFLNSIKNNELNIDFEGVEFNLSFNDLKKASLDPDLKG